jgi:hypothetical protein
MNRVVALCLPVRLGLSAGSIKDLRGADKSWTIGTYGGGDMSGPIIR